MKVFGRKLTDRNVRYGIEFDDIVFEVADGVEIRVSVYEANPMTWRAPITAIILESHG